MKLIEIDSHISEDFKDLVFTITQFNENGDSYELKVLGLYKGEELGFKVIVKKGMKAGVVDGIIDNTAFVKDGVSILSLGKESNLFLKVLSELYRLPVDKRFVDRFDFTIFPLEGAPDEIKTSHVKFKLFNDTENQDYYCELFLHINYPYSLLQFDEKDIEYRKGVINTLSNK